MSAPCRSSKARLPPLSAFAPTRVGSPAGLLGARRSTPPPHSNLPRRRPVLAAIPSVRSRHVFETPERSLADGRDRFLLILLSPATAGGSLLELDLGPSLLQGSLDLLSFFLGHAFLDGLRRSFDQVLGFLQAERCDGAHFLDHFDLLVAHRRQDDAELGLL